MIADDLAPLLERISPTDAGTPERLDKYWPDACRFAAEEVCKNLPSIRAAYDGQKFARLQIMKHIAEDGVRIRNEYMAKVV